MELQLPRRGRGRLGKPLSSRRLGLARHRPAVIAGGGAGAADFLGHGVDREALDAGGQLQRLDRLRVEKEVEKADMADAVVVDVLDGHRGAVDHHLAEVVARMLQGEGFLGHLLRVRNHPCRLDVDALVAAIDDEVDFVGWPNVLARLCRVVVDNSDVDGVSLPFQFVVDGVFHQVRELHLAESRPGVAKSGVGGVVFGRVVEVVVAANVKSRGLGEDEGVFQVAEILGNRVLGGRDAASRFQGIGKFCRIGETADVAHGNVDDRSEWLLSAQLHAFDDIAYVNRLVKPVEVGFLFLVGFEKRAFGKTAVAQVLVQDGVRIGCVPVQLEEFAKGERGDVNDLPSTSEFGCDIRTEQSGVGSCHIDIDIRHGTKGAQCLVKGDVRLRHILGMESREVDAFAQDRTAGLDLIQKNISPFPVVFDPRLNVFAQVYGIQQRIIIGLFEVNGNDMVIVSTRFKQMIAEQIEEQIAFPAPTNASDNFHKTVVFGSNKAVEKFLAIDGHLYPIFVLMGLYKKKRVKVYQNPRAQTRGLDRFFLYLSSKKRVRGFGSDGKKAFKEAA